MNTRDDRTEFDRERAQIDARFATIETRIGRPVSDAQRTEIEQRIGQSIALGAALRAYSLTNADEPEIGFLPYRSEDR